MARMPQSERFLHRLDWIAAAVKSLAIPGGAVFFFLSIAAREDFKEMARAFRDNDDDDHPLSDGNIDLMPARLIEDHPHEFSIVTLAAGVLLIWWLIQGQRRRTRAANA